MLIQPFMSWSSSARGALAAVSFLALCSAGQAQSQGPFAGMAGGWIGSGSIAMNDGAQEKIRCKASYTPSPSGDALHIELNCASDSYKVQVLSNVRAEADGTLSGVWHEITRQGEGTISGRVSGGGNLFQANLEGSGLTAAMSVSTRGKGQAVSITLQGTDVKSVSIEMKRA